jgi:hypothetical protein
MGRFFFLVSCSPALSEDFCSKAKEKQIPAKLNITTARRVASTST